MAVAVRVFYAFYVNFSQADIGSVTGWHNSYLGTEFHV